MGGYLELLTESHTINRHQLAASSKMTLTTSDPYLFKTHLALRLLEYVTLLPR